MHNESLYAKCRFSIQCSKSGRDYWPCHCINEILQPQHKHIHTQLFWITLDISVYLVNESHARMLALNWFQPTKVRDSFIEFFSSFFFFSYFSACSLLIKPMKITRYHDTCHNFPPSDTKSSINDKLSPNYIYIFDEHTQIVLRLLKYWFHLIMHGF